MTLLAAATLLSSQVFAASPKWDLVELDYVKIDIDDSNIEPDGFAVKWSSLVTDNIFVTGSYSATRDKINNVDLDYDNWNLGVGYKYSLGKSTDWFGTLSYVDVEAAANSRFAATSIDDNGFEITTGLRSMLTEKFELAGEISYVDIGDADETTITAKAYYYVTDNFALSAGYGIGGDAKELQIGARYAF